MRAKPKAKKFPFHPGFFEREPQLGAMEGPVAGVDEFSPHEGAPGTPFRRLRIDLITERAGKRRDGKIIVRRGPKLFRV